MRFVACAAAAALGMSLASAADAATYYVSVTGTLVEQLAPGTDPTPEFGVGDIFTIHARFEDNRVVTWGSHGYQVAGLHGVEAEGTGYLGLLVGGYTYTTYDDILDGNPFYSYMSSITAPGGVTTSESWQLGAPGIAFANGKVLGLSGQLAPTGDHPDIELGSSMGDGVEEFYNTEPGGPVTHNANFQPGVFSSEFTIFTGRYLYRNDYEGPAFRGVWDFENSTVTVVPEPATWAMMIIGFGLVGGAARRSRSLRPPVRFA